MLFNSISFLVFLPIVFGIYWMIQSKNYKWQNVLLLLASYYFYACWDWRFLFLLMFSTLLDYCSGLMMENMGQKGKRRFWFWTSILINVGFLGVFKYFNFFSESFAEAFHLIGIELSPFTLNIILPVGISFYTFHGLSYVIDIYNKKIYAERNFVDYAVFVSYFPLLVAGPIERATHLLPQIKKQRSFNYAQAVSGMRQILWGFFKKIVIADNCAVVVNQLFENPSSYSASTLALGAVLFAFQIYGDFSGYSDIALGTSRLFGIELLKNFSFPYFSRDIAEFWRRWHISLSSWFRDYVYIPLGGSKGGKWMQIRNTFIIFLLSGFWHGANWTFLIWGGLNAVFFLPLLISKNNRKNLDTVAMNRSFPNLQEFFMMLVTFTLTTLAWIFFRADSVSIAFEYIFGLFDKTFFSIPSIRPKALIILLVFFVWIEWIGRRNNFAIENFLDGRKRIFRYAFYILIVILLAFFGGSQQEFIYFQF